MNEEPWSPLRVTSRPEIQDTYVGDTCDKSTEDTIESRILTSTSPSQNGITERGHGVHVEQLQEPNARLQARAEEYSQPEGEK